MGLSAYVVDNGLVTMQNEADRLYLCTAEPTTYAEASSTFAVGNKNAGMGNLLIGPVDDHNGGRKLSTVAILDGTETATATARWWAIVDSINSRLLAAGEIAARGLNGTGLFTLPSFDIRMPST